MTTTLDLTGPKFDVSDIGLTLIKRETVWVSKATNQPLTLKLPPMEVVEAPFAFNGSTKIYNTKMKVYNNEKHAEKGALYRERLAILSDHMVRTYTEFILNPENSRKCIKDEPTFKDSADLHSRFKFLTLCDKGEILLRFKPMVQTLIFNVEESKKTGKGVVEPVRKDEDPRSFMAPSAVVQPMIVSLKAFAYNGKIYVGSMEAENMIIWNACQNQNISARPSFKRHEFLPEGDEGFALKIPFGFTGPAMQDKVPVHDIDTFTTPKFSKVVVGERGINIYTSVDGSSGPLYLRGHGVMRMDLKKGDNGERSLYMAKEEANQNLHRVTYDCWENILDVIEHDCEKIYGTGVKHSREVLNAICNSPFYSQKDANRTRSRVMLKLWLDPGAFEEGKKPDMKIIDKMKTEVFILRRPTDPTVETGTVERFVFKNPESSKELEPILKAGTAFQYVVNARFVMVGTTPYWTYKVVQLLIDPDQERIVAPTLSGFAFPGYESADVDELRNDVKVAPLGDNVIFTEPTPSQRGPACFQAFATGVDASGQPFETPYFLLPVVKSSFDVELVTDEAKQQFAFRPSFQVDKETHPTLKAFSDKILAHCKANVRKLVGQNWPAPAVEAAYNGIIRFGKKDEKKEFPKWGVNLPVYEDKDNASKVDISFETYSLNPGWNGGKPYIRKVPMSVREDVQKAYTQGIRVLQIATCKVWFVNSKISPSFTVVQTMIVPANMEAGIPFEDTDGMAEMAMMASVSSEKKKNDIPEFVAEGGLPPIDGFHVPTPVDRHPADTMSEQSAQLNVEVVSHPDDHALYTGLGSDE